MTRKLVVYILSSCLLGVAGGATGSTPRPAQLGAGMQDSFYPDKPLKPVPFRYVIYWSRVSAVSPERPDLNHRLVLILMEKNAFSEDNLRTLFDAISTAYSDPDRFTIHVSTSLEQADPLPAQRSGPRSSSITDKSFEHNHAVYIRYGGNEYFRYTVNPPSQEVKTVVLRGRDPVTKKTADSSPGR